MSNPLSCAPQCCDTPLPTQIPGPQGEQGAAGSDGQDGKNAFTITTGDFTVPSIDGTVTILVADSSWATIGQNVFVQGAGTFTMTAKPSDVAMTLSYPAYAGNSHSADTITTGAQVSPAGTQEVVSGIAQFTDDSGGTQSSTIAAGVGIQTLSFYIDAATIANGDLLTEYVPGYAFKILKFDARCAKAVTTGAKASTLNLEINGVNLTGGVISLAGTYALGAAQAGTAVTANNTGAATDSISIEASSTTAFVEGAFWLIISLVNSDTANALASLAKKQNDLLTQLTA